MKDIFNGHFIGINFISKGQMSLQDNADSKQNNKMAYFSHPPTEPTNSGYTIKHQPQRW